MTRYTVVWVQSVEDELVELWLAANDRNDVTVATHAVVIKNWAPMPNRKATISPKG